MTPDISLFARVETMLFLLTIATLGAIVLKRFKVPYTIGLVPVGILIAALIGCFPKLQPYRNLQLSQELIMYVLLPALIFDASINIDAKLLRRNLFPTLMLAAPGLVIATVLTGGIMYLWGGLSLGGAMLFGALISATDPVAVISLFELVGAPRRLRILVDGESLFNDATAIAMYNVVAKMVFAGVAFSAVSVGSGAWEFCWAFLGGVLFGAFVGWLMILIMGWADDNDAHIKVALSIILAYGAFLTADRALHVSGVMAVLGAGVVVSYFGVTRLTERVRGYMHDFWAFMSFLANSAIFLLLGFTETHVLFDTTGGATIRMIVMAILAIQIARAVVVFGISPFLGRGDKKIGIPYQLVMFWGGLRGAVPLALVFSIAADYPERTAILQITLAVVLFTLVVQGLTTRRLLSIFQLDRPTLFARIGDRLSMWHARLAGRDRLRRLQEYGVFESRTLELLLAEYETKITAVREGLETELAAAPELGQRAVWARTNLAEQAMMARLFRCGLLSERACRRLLMGNSETVSRIEECQFPDPAFEERIFRSTYPRRWQRLLLLRWFRRLFPQYSAALMCDAFAILTAGIAGTEAALKAFENAPERLAADDRTLCAVRDLYEARRRRLLREFRKLRRLAPHLFTKAQLYTLRSLVYDIEFESIQADHDSGAIDEVEFDRLTDFIRRNRASSQQEVRS